MSEMPKTAPGTWQSACCEGERCHCGAPACAKVEEVIFPDDPAPRRHPLTAYLCRDHFREVMGAASVAFVDGFRKHTPPTGGSLAGRFTRGEVDEIEVQP